MDYKRYQKIVEEVLTSSRVDIKMNGKRPWDVKINDPAVYRLILSGDTLALGEAYMDKKWDCDQIDIMLTKLFESNLVDQIELKTKVKVALGFIETKLFNPTPKSKAFEVADTHYNLGNDLFKAMLDKRLVYTCGYWSGQPKATNLDQAQEAKLDLICRKIGLKKGMRVLDIGGGWGSFAKFAAEKYGASVVNVTVAKEQVELANELCKGLPVENRLQDYRDIKGEKFDRIVSIGMFEHVGYKNYKTFFKIARENLKPDGIFLLHCIGTNKSVTHTDPWIEKYIFPNSMLPSIEQIGHNIEDLFVMEDWHNFGPDYDKTLMAWHNNFEKAWPKLKDKYSDRFYRMWRLYLLCCAAIFRTRRIQLWQLVLTPTGLREGYQSVR